MHIKTETSVGLFIIAALGAFFYMTFQIGVFRFDKARYAPYTAYFKDISGLAKKGQVKIAGVKVGWVESIELDQNGSDVRVELMVLKDYILHANSQAMIRQEGILGAKYIEIIPGDSLTPRLYAGGKLAREGRSSVSVDDLMHTFQKIAHNVEEVSSSIKDVLVGGDGSQQLKQTIQHFGQAAQKIASVSESLERMVSHNEHNFGTIMSDMRDLMHDLKDRMPALVGDLAKVAESLNGDFLPKISDSISSTGGSFKETADEIRTIVQSLKERLPGLTDNLSRVAQRLNDDILPKIADNINNVAQNLHSDFLPTVAQNTSRIADSIASSGSSFKGAADEVKDAVHELKNKIVPVTETLSRVGNQLQSDFLPRIAQDADTFTRSFESTADAFKAVAGQVGEGISQARESFKEVQQVVSKINDGQGLLGKIINEDETYNDLRSTVRSIRNSFDKLERLAIVLDTHFESMYGLAEKYNFQDAKAFINLRLYPCEDYFYLAGLAFSQKGYVCREVFNYKYFDEKNRPILPSELLRTGQLCDLVARTEVTKERRDALSVNLQVGKIFDNFALRLGLFEGSAGLAVDYRIPLTDCMFKWITTFEAYDFRGRNRIFKDDRPHLKWLNKVFVTPNIYLAFGADDFISRYNKNAFFGAGIRFSDDDLKYVLTKSCVGL